MIDAQNATEDKVKELNASFVDGDLDTIIELLNQGVQLKNKA